MNQPPANGEPENSGLPPETAPELRPDLRIELGAGVREGEPGWAKGLRKLYNSVVDEPLPDSFRDLLKKLDGSDDD